MAYVGPFSMIIPQGVKQNSSDVFNILDPDAGGAATFSVPLSADGFVPATHWGARSMLETETANALQNMTVAEFKAYVDQVSIIRGRTPVGSITAFKNALLLSVEAFWPFAAANGLQLVQEPE